MLPANATNAHCHVFGPRTSFPYAQGAAFVPSQDAPKEALFALNDELGLHRCVVVQSACHGFDNRAMEDALIARPASYRGIALLPTDVPDQELLRLHQLGVRGVRKDAPNKYRPARSSRKRDGLVRHDHAGHSRAMPNVSR
jgi:2-pyrone-4,6-dicarboxylate lactonase